MSVSKVKTFFLSFGLLFILLSFAIFIARGQNNNSANVANVSSENTNTITNQNVSADETEKETDNTNASEKEEAKPTPTPCDPESNLNVAQVYKDVKVTNAYKHRDKNLPKNKTNEKNKTVELGDTIVVEVKNLELLLNRKQCLSGDPEEKEIVLFLDNHPLKNTTEHPPVNPQTGVVHFTLKRNDDTKDVWTYLLEKPRWQTSKTKVSIGFEDAYALDSGENAFINLAVIPHAWSIFWAVVVLIFLIGFLYLARNTNIIRSPGENPATGHSLSYSLARTQAAWWFFIIIASYLLIGIITGDFNTTITSTVLGLFGISAGTAVGSAFVDANKNTEVNRQKKLKEANAADAAVEKLKATSPNEMQTAEVIEEEKIIQTDKSKKLRGISIGFFGDILRDKDGISFHRFQAVTLSIILGFIFIYQVYTNLAMPEFSGTLLTLLLISSGTYLGFKLPQNNN